MELITYMPVLAQSDGSGGGIVALLMGLVFFAIWVAVMGVVVAGMWKTFVKAGHPGWAALVPIYNLWILVQMSGKEDWWIALFFFPVLNFIAVIVISMEIAQKFGKGSGFGIAMAFFPYICYPLLGFGSATYEGGAAQSEAAMVA